MHVLSHSPDKGNYLFFPFIVFTVPVIFSIPFPIDIVCMMTDCMMTDCNTTIYTVSG